MASLHDVLVYICKHYPHKQELSKARLTKMVYLADWRAAIEQGRQLTSLRWTFNHYGPYLDDVVQEARASKDLDVETTRNMYGGLKELVAVRDETPEPPMSDSDRAILDHVIEETAPLYWNDFMKLVYSTYPIVTQERYTTLDLVELAKEYQRVTLELQS
jgi:hypothetical protein